MFDEEGFRREALDLLALPLDERTLAFSGLVERHQASIFPPAKTADDVFANTARLRTVWSIGAEIGVMAPPPTEH